MKTVSLSGSIRESVGKKDAKKNRREGKIPCVLYGGEKQIPFVLTKLDFDKLIFTADVYLLQLTIEGAEHRAILQDVQFHPVTDKVLHADFLEVKEDKPITIGLPVRFSGNVPGVMAGGRLIKKMRKVLVKSLSANIPDFIEVDMSDMNIGDTVQIKDLKINDVEFLDHEYAVVVMVKMARGADEEDEEEDEEGEEGEEGEAEEGSEAAPKE